MKWHRFSITKQELLQGILDPLIEMDEESKEKSPDNISWMVKNHFAIWKEEDTQHIHLYLSQLVLHYFRVVIPNEKVASCEKPNQEDVEFYRGDKTSKELLNDDL